MTFKEIGKALGISEENARAIYIKALAKLSHPRNKEKWRKIIEAIGEIEAEQAKRDSKTSDYKIV